MMESLGRAKLAWICCDNMIFAWFSLLFGAQELSILGFGGFDDLKDWFWGIHLVRTVWMSFRCQSMFWPWNMVEYDIFVVYLCSWCAFGLTVEQVRLNVAERRRPPQNAFHSAIQLLSTLKTSSQESNLTSSAEDDIKSLALGTRDR